jgi:hypothetical protein
LANSSGSDTRNKVKSDYTPVASEKKTDIDLQTIENKWNDLVEEVKKRKIALGSFLSGGWPTKLEQNTLEITFDKNNGFHIDSIQKNRDYIRNVMRSFFGAPLGIKCVKDENGTLDKVRKIDFKVDKKKAFENIKSKNPIIDEMVSRLDIELIK